MVAIKHRYFTSIVVRPVVIGLFMCGKTKAQEYYLTFLGLPNLFTCCHCSYRVSSTCSHVWLILVTLCEQNGTASSVIPNHSSRQGVHMSVRVSFLLPSFFLLSLLLSSLALPYMHTPLMSSFYILIEIQIP